MVCIGQRMILIMRNTLLSESDSDGINSLEEVNQEKHFFFPAPNILAHFMESLLRHHSGELL